MEVNDVTDKKEDMKAGDKVVCINDDWLDPYGKTGGTLDPKRGDIDTIALVTKAPDWTHIKDDFIRLVGRPSRYRISYFRPVDDTFGPAVCERIEEMIEYEKVISQ